jgi:hypothetical protein
MAHRIADELDYPKMGRLLVTSLLHDVGELALAWMSPKYMAELGSSDLIREEQLEREEQRFGITHARAGALFAKWWGLPRVICRAIECHHQRGPTGEAAIIRLADLLAYHAAGDDISKREAVTAARDAGMGTATLRRLLYELPVSSTSEQRGQGSRRPLVPPRARCSAATRSGQELRGHRGRPRSLAKHGQCASAQPVQEAGYA